MKDVLSEAISLVNLPFTVLLGLVICYWLLVALGAVSDHSAETDGHLDGHDAGDWLAGPLHFINLGDVPVMVALSIYSLCLWTCSLITNHYFTDHKALLALAYLLPNLLVSGLVTRYLTLPLKPVFGWVRRAEGDEPPLIGRSCRITTSMADATFGQAEVTTSGAPLLIDVRTTDGVSLPRGTNVVIFREDLERGIYFVVPVSDPQLS